MAGSQVYSFNVDGFALSGSFQSISQKHFSFKAHEPYERFSFEGDSKDGDFIDLNGNITNYCLDYVEHFLGRRMLYYKAASNSQSDL